ncbi:phosphotransferase family protein [Iamia sp. SCSIO 61187]|uniref:phosphotransferase family protein n=1 Tax=Iamia sp. SCSIO 61187 TaxID=2722752 RepID=UPI001C62C194|nr:phosphotransferase family protein [Iamia sp. SCSIO 61187]QYG93423.1 phosphotransferase family protein [Iamia sp. SCSIO 61187]
MSDEVPQGVDPQQITAWLSERADVHPPLRFERIAGGQSNLTYRVFDTTGLRWVLRRPPLGQVLATAHDMGRESRIIEALAPTDVPVAPLVGASLDDSVNGAPFYVMEFVEGHVVRGEAEAAVLSPQARAHAGEQLIDVMARIHAVDPDAVGLGDLGRREGYIPRQLKRWYGQWEKSKSREIPHVDQVHDALLASVPEQGPATIVHGDYRLDNCLLTDDGDVAAVLDWEICTLGDPLADLGLLVVYWGEDESGFTALPGGATRAEGFPPASALVARYAEASGRDVSQVDFYVAFGYWKLACILEGVYSRYRGGAMGASDDGAWELFAKQVEMLADAAAATVDRMSGSGSG